MSDISLLKTAAEAFPDKRIVYPKPNEVFIDIDTKDQYTIFVSRLAELLFLGIKYNIVYLDKSSSGYPHRHIILEFERSFTPLERVAMQYMLSSDPVREKLAAFKCLIGLEDESSVFAENT